MKYYLKQKKFSFKDKFTVKDEKGNDLFQVQGKVFSMKNKIDLMNMDGSTVLSAEKKMWSFVATYFILSPHNEQIAVVKRKFGLKPNFSVSMGNEELTVNGSIFGHQFVIKNEGEEVVKISKKIISWGDAYEVDIVDEHHKELLLFVVIIIDQIMEEAAKRNAN
jgi:uncharacterized protein YxjI